MAHTGLNQAVIVYKVDENGNALDVNGALISESGRLQAIALLMFTANPDPTKYEVELYFNPEDSIDGTPTVEFSANCAAGYIFIFPAAVTVTTAAPTNTALIASSGPWTAPVPNFVTLNRYAGPRGETVIIITRTATVGQETVIFTNTLTGQTAALYVVNVNTVVWILADHTWNFLGFWQDTGIWNF